MSANVLFDAPGPKARRRHLLLGAIGTLLVLGILALFVWKLQEQGQFASEKWKPFSKSEIWTSYIWPGLVGTLKAAAISIVLATVLGAVLALARMSEIRPLRWVAGAFVEVFRAIPVLIMMIFAWAVFVNANVFSSDLSPLAGVVTGLTLYNGAVIAEVIRAGVGSLPSGQREAGLSIGLKPQQTLRTILLPQAVTAMLPTLVSQLVVILKDTALGFQITYVDLLRNGNNAGSNYQNLVPVIMVIAVIYILINYAITKLAEWIERRLARRGRVVATPDNQAGGLAGQVQGPDMRHNTETY